MTRRGVIEVFKDFGHNIVEMGGVLVIGVVVVIPMFLWAGNHAANTIARNLADLGDHRPDEAALRKRFQEQFPGVKIASVNCQRVSGLCEFLAGRDLYYTDQKNRYLFIGRVYDIQTRADLTARWQAEASLDQARRGRS